MNNTFCTSLIKYHRRKSWVVNIGNVPLGGNHKVRIQSMTNTNTLDTEATVNQCIRLIEAGAEYVRITAPGIKEAENLANIKDQLRSKGYDTPLIADIHFNPKAAEIAAKIVEKVRINPGNYIDKKKFESIEYTDNEYIAEVEKIKERFMPLIEICKLHGTAMRIGTNHGSLSDRIMSRYGDTPLGMVEATMEFLRICMEANYRDVVISLKASNTRIMVQAYRLMVNKMEAEGMYFPLHLGVTEAGDGEDGRIKSAIGTGALLADGIGDTIRVSLTEAPENEIPAAQKLVEHIQHISSDNIINSTYNHLTFNPFEYNKRPSKKIKNLIGGNNRVLVCARQNVPKNRKTAYPDIVFLPQGIQSEKKEIELLHFVEIDCNNLTMSHLADAISQPNTVLVAEASTQNPIALWRNLFFALMELNSDVPVILKKTYSETQLEKLQIAAACDVGALLIDGFADGIFIENQSDTISQQEVVSLMFGILQGSRVRYTKTEYISCPSCGRTLFDLEDVTAKIKAQTNHLTGLKIGIMGCIVNGPGEMADADYGYVGTGIGKVNLYKGKTVMKRNIASENAVFELINLIKEHGDWKENTQELANL